MSEYLIDPSPKKMPYVMCGYMSCRECKFRETCKCASYSDGPKLKPPVVAKGTGVNSIAFVLFSGVVVYMLGAITGSLLSALFSF